MALKLFRQNFTERIAGRTTGGQGTTLDIASPPDKLLSTFTGASTPEAAAKSLECLVASLRAVVITEVDRAGFAVEDAEDIKGAILARLVEALWNHRDGVSRAGSTRESSDNAIRDIAGYTRVLAANGVADTLRKRRPAWHRLKRRLVYLLDTPPPDKKPPLFARWQFASDWLGGLARWRGTGFRATSAYASFAAEESRFWKQLPGGEDPAALSLPALLTRLFRALDTPVEMDALTRHIAALCGITDPLPVSLDHGHQSTEGTTSPIDPPARECTEASVIESLTDEVMRAALAREIALLPVRQRTALLLAMQRDDLILLLGTAGEVAVLLEISCEEIASLWNALPLSDPTIAARLDASTVQVSNLRKCARERLTRQKERWTE